MPRTGIEGALYLDAQRKSPPCWFFQLANQNVWPQFPFSYPSVQCGRVG